MSNIESNTFYFIKKKRKAKIIAYLSNKIYFDNIFNSSKYTYLESSKYLIIIANQYIRVNTFNKNTPDIIKINNLINDINAGNI